MEHGLKNYNVLITVHCSDNSENIAVSIATNVTARDVCVTHWNDLS